MVNGRSFGPIYIGLGALTILFFHLFDYFRRKKRKKKRTPRRLVVPPHAPIATPEASKEAPKASYSKMQPTSNVGEDKPIRHRRKITRSITKP
jgi:hypothetical protein